MKQKFEIYFIFRFHNGLVVREEKMKSVKRIKK